MAFGQAPCLPLVGMFMLKRALSAQASKSPCSTQRDSAGLNQGRQHSCEGPFEEKWGFNALHRMHR